MRGKNFIMPHLKKLLDKHKIDMYSTLMKEKLSLLNDLTEH